MDRIVHWPLAVLEVGLGLTRSWCYRCPSTHGWLGRGRGGGGSVWHGAEVGTWRVGDYTNGTHTPMHFEVFIFFFFCTIFFFSEFLQLS
ncbi:GL25381 [Drosophila persimilis]|uniref:GL25381 n=1 Tax=Drosophila persimilis TaxID=7234 RepID=B4IR03_DROPE|nr:GL25381 [Drosophila persimilis]